MNGLGLKETDIFSQYRAAGETQINRLLNQYSTSLTGMRERMPQFVETVKTWRETTFPNQPLFFNAEEAQQMGVSLDEGWLLKLIPFEGGYKSSFITPQKWEITEDDLYISPEGTQYSKADIEALLSMPMGGLGTTPTPLSVEDLTEEGQRLYEEYQQAGGTLNVVDWLQEREQQQLEATEIFGRVFPEQDIAEVANLINTNPEQFLADIREIGRTADTESLLKYLMPEITERDMMQIFGEGFGLGEIATTQLPLKIPSLPFPQTPVWATTTTPLETMGFPEAYGEVPTIEAVPFKDAAYVFAGSIKLLPAQIGISILQAIQGQAGASVVNRDWADKQIAIANENLDRFVEEVAAQYPNSQFLLDVAQLSRNLAYSITTMGAGNLVALPLWLVPEPTGGTKVAAAATAGAVSGYISFRMTTYQVMQEYLEYKNQEKIALTGEGLTLEEENKLKTDFHTDAVKYGLWEAVPEGISNMLFSGILGGSFNNALTRIVGQKAAQQIGSSLIAKFGSKAFGIYGEELLTETITQKGQAAIEVEAGLREKNITWAEAFREIAPQTFLLTTIMAGAGQAIVKVSGTIRARTSTENVDKILTSLKDEIGEGNLLYDELKQRVEEELGKGTITEEDAKKILEAGLAQKFLSDIKIAEELKPSLGQVTLIQTQYEEGLYAINIEGREGSVGAIVAIPQGDALFVNRISMHEKGVLTRSLLRNIDEQLISIAQTQGLKRIKIAAKPETMALYSRAGYVQEPGTNVMTKEVPAGMAIPTTEAGVPEAGLQPPLIEGVPAKEVRPEARGKLVQARLDDYLRLREYNSKATTNRVNEIKELLSKKGRLPKELGLKGNLRIELAGLEALQEIEAVETIEELDWLIRQVALEIGNRSLPYHGGAKNIFPEYNTAQLDEIMKVYQQARQNLSPEVPAVSLLKAKDIPIDIPALENTQLTPKQIKRTLDLFKEAVAAPTIEAQRAATIELRKHVFAQRAKAASESAEAMIAEGMNPEEAIKAAEQIFMTGKLPEVTTEYFDDLTQEMRNVLFAKVYNYWKDKSWTELIATHEALTNALAGKSIPRERGTGTKYFPDGGSAWDRLVRVFIDDMEILDALDKRKSLHNIIQGFTLQVGRGELTLNQETVAWLKELSEISEEDKILLSRPLSEITEVEVNRIAQSWFYKRVHELDALLKDKVITEQEYKFELALAKDRVFPYKEIAPAVSYPEGTFKQLPLLTFREKGTIVRTLKNIGLTIVDIGNAARANKASFDLSYWRQAAALGIGHPADFYGSNIDAWKALWSQEAFEGQQKRITSSPRFEEYERIRKETGADPLRELIAPKGTAQWRAAEEFGYLTGERPIPRLMAKVPWIKYSGRHFVAGTNSLVWRIWNKEYNLALREAEKIASGEIVLPEGEAFSIHQRMIKVQGYLADAIQRASLGKASKLAPALGATFFAPRSKLARFLYPRHLISSDPHVRALAWKDFVAWTGVRIAVVMLGWTLGLWDVERDPRNAEFMSIRIGNMRIDPWAGYRQFVVLYARLITGTGISSVTGQEYEINPIGTLTTFFRTSLAPLSSTLLSFWTGKNFLGEEVDIKDPKQWVEQIAPFSMQDIWEAFQEDWQKGAIAILPAIVGEGVQTYSGDWTDNWEKLGLPKYPENTGYGLDEPVYDLADFWTDTSGQFRDVDPETLTESKGYPPYVRSIATALQIIEQVNLLPNKRLASINADPDEGLTFQDYYQMWQQRQDLVNASDDAQFTVRELQPNGTYKEVTYKGEDAVEAFDKDDRYKYAYLGNMTQAQYSLLMKYHSLPEGQKAEFLANHPELYINPRKEWLRNHPEENALLALWLDPDTHGIEANVYTLDALNKIPTLAGSLGIPESAMFEREIDEVTKLKIQHSQLFDLLDVYGGLDDTVKDDEGLTARDRAIQELYEEHPDFRDDIRRIEALSIGTLEEPTPEDIVEAWVDRGRIVDEFGANSYEAKLWLIDNPEAHHWALDHAILTDDGTDWNEPVLRLQVQYRDDFDLYSAYGDITSDNFIEDDEQRADARYQLLHREDGTLVSFGRAYYTVKAYKEEFPESLIPDYVEWYGVIQHKKDYEDDWWLLQHEDFYNTMLEMKIWTKPRDFSKVPTREVYDLYKTYLALPKGNPRYDFRAQHPELDAWLVLAFDYKPIEDRGKPEPSEWEEILPWLKYREGQPT